MRLNPLSASFLCALLCSSIGHAEQGKIEVEISKLDERGLGEKIGSIRFEDTRYGLLITPALRDLQPGAHALHLHELPDCGVKKTEDGAIVPGGAAGGHYDPQKTGAHRGPYAEGHLGDMPNLFAGVDGTSTVAMLAPRLKLADLRARAVMLHAGVDLYTDDAGNHEHHEHHDHTKAADASKGGSRMYCGVVSN